VPLPAPVPGLVIRYSYLWADEHNRGREEGRKDRPGAVVMAVANRDGEWTVTVLPIRHALPTDPALAVELPIATKRRLGLDAERSWIVLSEANRFRWPGPDLRPAVPGDMETVAYGFLPFALFEQVRRQLIAAIHRHRARLVPRTE
jgi:hypothetical protein